MENQDAPFSRRFGGVSEPLPIQIRYEAPPSLRFALIALAERGGLGTSATLDAITRALLIAPEGNWTGSYIEEELHRLLRTIPWEQVYDVAEVIYLRLSDLHERIGADPPPHEWFERELNHFFLKNGIGWVMVDGHIEFRGPQPLEDEVNTSAASMLETGRPTAARELAEARADLSRRPQPDVTGAIQHALASLECLARDVADDPKATFGDLIKRNPNLFPKPLDGAMHQLWGYASEFARHLREGREPDLAEAILIVGLAASTSAFLMEKDAKAFA